MSFVLHTACTVGEAMIEDASSPFEGHPDADAKRHSSIRLTSRERRCEENVRKRIPRPRRSTLKVVCPHDEEDLSRCKRSRLGGRQDYTMTMSSHTLHYHSSPLTSPVARWLHMAYLHSLLHRRRVWGDQIPMTNISSENVLCVSELRQATRGTKQWGGCQ